MSEQNILNPSTTSPLNPDYSVKITDPQVAARWQARSGKAFFRRLAARGKMFDLTWNKRLFADYQTLRQWFAQYENDYFTFADYDQSPTRYYTGMFADQPTVSRDANNQVTIQGQFVEVPGLPMYQYPSPLGADSIILDERGGFGDLVKLTGTAWDYADKNYCLWSEQFDNGAWVKETNVTVTANTQADPNGNMTADTIATGATASAGVYQVLGQAARKGWQFTFSVYLKAPSNTSVSLILESAAGGDVEFVTVTVTTAWQRFSLAHSGTWASAQGLQPTLRLVNASSTIYAWGAQVEYGAAATTYAQTTNAVAPLSAPNSLSALHAGHAYFHPGNNNTDAAEWSYFGYGCRLLTPTGPDMGIAFISIDGAGNNYDLYSAAVVNSAPLYLGADGNVLGFHRVKVMPTNTKNASSSNTYVCADGIQVAR